MSGDGQGAEPAGAWGAAGTSGGWWYAWWRGDPLATLGPLAGLRITSTDDPGRLTAITGQSETGLLARLRAGHRPYLAEIDEAAVGYAVGYGWSAAHRASIGQLGLSFTLPPGNRYLWDFATQPGWRGRGVYPRLLQAILAEEADAERFWIGHEPANTASARGILNAGFVRVIEIRFEREGVVARIAEGTPERARAAAAILGVPLRAE